MTLYDWLRLAGNVLIHWAALAAVISVILHLRVEWWHTEMGRHIMAYQFVLAAVFLLTCLSIDFIGGTLWFAVIRLAVFVGVPLVLTQRAWIHFKAQRDVKREIGKHRE